MKYLLYFSEMVVLAEAAEMLGTEIQRVVVKESDDQKEFSCVSVDSLNPEVVQEKLQRTTHGFLVSEDEEVWRHATLQELCASAA